MTGSRRSGDCLIHQRPPQIIDPGIQTRPNTIVTELRPGRLDILKQWIQYQSCDRMNQHRFPEGGSLTSIAFLIHRRFHMHKRQNHEFREPTGTRLQITDSEQMSRDVLILFHVTKHDGGRSRKA